MNYNEMTSAQCADWLAEKDGWESVDNPTIERWSEHTRWRRRLPDGKSWEYHADPMPMTLDAAAGALREPWDWDYIEWWEDGTEASVRNMETGKKLAHLAPDELTARYRAAVAARMEEDK